MRLLLNPSPEKWKKELARPVQKTKEINKIVKPILIKVQKNGDKALRKFAQEYDHVQLESLLVTSEEIQTARESVSQELIEAIAVAKTNIERFHAAQRTPELIEEVMPGVVCRLSLIHISEPTRPY